MSKKFSIVIVAALTLALGAFPAVAQKKGGVLRFATPSVRPGLDPARTTTGDQYMLTAMIFSNLTRIDYNLKPQPQLASSWEANADSTEWTFHLVKNAKFSNGRAVVADDVKFSIDRILDPKTASQGAKAMGPIQEVVVKDPHTVVFKLKGPYADLPLQLGNTFGRIIAKENVADISHKPIGSGPFLLKEYIPGNKAVLVKNPNYFEKGIPVLDEVDQVYIKEYAAQLSALKTGEIDIMYFAPVELMDEIKADPNIKVLMVPAPSFQPIVMFAQNKPFNDVRVRQAFRLALDRQAMMEAATGGYGSLGNDSPVGPGNPYYDKKLPQRKRDIPKAKKLLAEAGYPKGMDITFYTSTERTGLEPSAVVAQQSLADAGFRVKIESVEIARLFKDILPKPRDFAVAHNNWFGRPTIDETLSPYYYTKSNWNYSQYSNPALDKLLDQAKSLTDVKERAKLYNKISGNSLQPRHGSDSVLQKLRVRRTQGGSELQADPRAIRRPA